jgi:hypothetical protein
MARCFNIAFGGRPNPGFMDTFRGICKGEGVDLRVATLTTGPGCYNLGIMIEHEDAKNFVTQLTLALMPAKYEELTDDPLLVEGEFRTQL